MSTKTEKTKAKSQDQAADDTQDLNRTQKVSSDESAKKVTPDSDANSNGKDAGDSVPTPDVDEAEANVVNSAGAKEAANDNVIADQMQSRGPSLMETTMSAASAQGRPALDAHAAAQGIVVTREDQKIASDIRDQAEATSSDEQLDGE